VLDLNAERMRFMHEEAEGYSGLTDGRFDLIGSLAGRRLGFGSATETPTPEIGRSRAYALSARLHLIRHATPAQAAILTARFSDATLRSAINRIDRIERGAQGATPPGDWNAWISDVVAADADLHSGTAGVVDTAFFRAIRSYAARARAPQQARHALDFLHGIGAWDWAEAAAAAKALYASNDSIAWLPPDLMRNGSATAFIVTRDTAAAKDVLRRFARHYNEDRMRERIIGSILISLDPKLREQMGWR
jgi:hypothetical protein